MTGRRSNLNSQYFMLMLPTARFPYCQRTSTATPTPPFVSLLTTYIFHRVSTTNNSSRHGHHRRARHPRNSTISRRNVPQFPKNALPHQHSFGGHPCPSPAHSKILHHRGYLCISTSNGFVRTYVVNLCDPSAHRIRRRVRLNGREIGSR
jgi:hypothetical protein